MNWLDCCDIALAEDACQIQNGSAPHALAALNSFVLTFFDFCQVPHAKQQMRCLDAYLRLPVSCSSLWRKIK